MRPLRASSRQSRRSKAAGAFLIAAFALCAVAARAAETSAQTHDGDAKTRDVDAKTRDVDAKTRDGITVEGNSRIDADTVRSYFHPSPDGRFDEAARDAALKALLATNLFDKVTIDRVGERLVVHLTEAPLLDKVSFEGNKKIKRLTAMPAATMSA
jgi:outer membrane protein assembly factor BamA